MSTVGNGLGASQDCLTYTASFNAAQSRRDEAIDAIAPRATEKIAFGASPMNDSTVTLNGTAVTFAASPSVFIAPTAVAASPAAHYGPAAAGGSLG